MIPFLVDPRIFQNFLVIIIDHRFVCRYESKFLLEQIEIKKQKCKNGGRLNRQECVNQYTVFVSVYVSVCVIVLQIYIDFSKIMNARIRVCKKEILPIYGPIRRRCFHLALYFKVKICFCCFQDIHPWFQHCCHSVSPLLWAFSNECILVIALRMHSDVFFYLRPITRTHRHRDTHYSQWSE